MANNKKEITPGLTFGDWTALSASSKKYHWTCQCICGLIKDVNASALRLGMSTSCSNCAQVKRAEEMRLKKVKEMIGSRFGRLVVMDWTKNDNNKTLYICNCDCGNVMEVPKQHLTMGKTKSCGCLRKEKSAEISKEPFLKGKRKHAELSVENTNLSSLTAKKPKSNTSGIKGVSKMKDGKYRAYIYFQRKRIHLGVFNTIEEAESARLEAEKELFSPLLEKYKYKKK